MTNLLLAIHIIIAIGLMAAILLQRSEGGGLGIGGGGGGGGGMGNLFTGRGTANFLTRTTMVLAVGFFTTSILLAILAGGWGGVRSVLDEVPTSTEEPAAAPESEEPSVPIR